MEKKGIHTYDNQYCAVSNTIAAVNQGKHNRSYSYGNGRGPGNANRDNS